MDLTPLGTAAAPPTVAPEQKLQAPIALADTPLFAAARAADAQRVRQEGRRDRTALIGSISVMALAALIGVIVIVHFAAESRDKNMAFQAKLSQAYEGRKESERMIAANEAARRDENMRQTREMQAHKMTNAEVRASNSVTYQARTGRTFVPQQPAVVSPPVAPLGEYAEAASPTMPSATPPRLMTPQEQFYQVYLPSIGISPNQVGSTVTYSYDRNGDMLARFIGTDGNGYFFRYRGGVWSQDGVHIFPHAPHRGLFEEPG